MPLSAASWLNCSIAGAITVRCNAEGVPGHGTKSAKQEILSLKPSLAWRYGKSARSQFQDFSPSCNGGRVSFPVPRSASSSFSVEDEAVEEDGFEGSPEGSNVEDDPDIMKVVMQRLSEEDLEEAAKKYKYEDELFAQIDFAQINAFTSTPFSGNPAAVCYLPYERDEKWLQLIAREFNLPATAFVVKRRVSKKDQAGEAGSPSLIEVDDSGKGLKPVKKSVGPIENEFDIRWFSTAAELELCGHATLASAHMLFSSGLVDGDTIIFHNEKGRLKAVKIAGYDEPHDSRDLLEEDEEDPEARIQAKVELGKGVVELDFPLNLVSQVEVSEAQVVSDALGGVETLWVGKTSMGDYLTCTITKGPNTSGLASLTEAIVNRVGGNLSLPDDRTLVLQIYNNLFGKVELPSSKHVEELAPLAERMIRLPGRGVIATARASEDSKFDFISRFFAPKIGIPEDPVCGSAHCTLGPYWVTKLGRESLRAYQASPRGGELSVRVDLDAGRVYLQGGAVLLMAGTLLNTFRT